MADDVERFDLVVIGSGPAGEKGAAQAAYFGKKVALVEKAPALGGACVHTGHAAVEDAARDGAVRDGLPAPQPLRHDAGGRSRRQPAPAHGAPARGHRAAGRADRAQHRPARRDHRRAARPSSSARTRSSCARRRDRRHAAAHRRRYFLIAPGSSPHRPARRAVRRPRRRGLRHDPRPGSHPAVAGRRRRRRHRLRVRLPVRGARHGITIIEGRGTLMGGLDGEMSAGSRPRSSASGTRGHARRRRLGIERDPGRPAAHRAQEGKRLQVDKVLYSAGRAGNTQGSGSTRPA